MRHHACPWAGCAAKFARRHDVERDDALCAQLQSVPLSVDTVWLSSSGGELLTSKPTNRPLPAAPLARVDATVWATERSSNVRKRARGQTATMPIVVDE